MFKSKHSLLLSGWSYQLVPLLFCLINCSVISFDFPPVQCPLSTTVCKQTGQFPANFYCSSAQACSTSFPYCQTSVEYASPCDTGTNISLTSFPQYTVGQDASPSVYSIVESYHDIELFEWDGGKCKSTLTGTKPNSTSNINGFGKFTQSRVLSFSSLARCESYHERFVTTAADIRQYCISSNPPPKSTVNTVCRNNTSPAWSRSGRLEYYPVCADIWAWNSSCYVCGVTGHYGGCKPTVIEQYCQCRDDSTVLIEAFVTASESGLLSSGDICSVALDAVTDVVTRIACRATGWFAPICVFTENLLDNAIDGVILTLGFGSMCALIVSQVYKGQVTIPAMSRADHDKNVMLIKEKFCVALDPKFANCVYSSGSTNDDDDRCCIIM